ncbi:MAG: nuclear transport factor 2 family protein [Deltaproteobacteria bacterium]|nr:nuclear transport factor 2 family protein [Deltaproteobacteria bacterium]
MPDLETANLDLIHRYLAAVQAGATGATLAAFYHSDAIQEELPNRLVAQGTRRDLAGLLASAERGQQVISEQRYQIVRELAQGGRVALEVTWSGTLRIALGTLAAGHVMRAHLAMFFDIEAGRIRGQRNYDCFEPW